MRTVISNSIHQHSIQGRNLQDSQDRSLYSMIGDSLIITSRLIKTHRQREKRMTLRESGLFTRDLTVSTISLKGKTQRRSTSDWQYFLSK